RANIGAQRIQLGLIHFSIGRDEVLFNHPYQDLCISADLIHHSSNGTVAGIISSIQQQTAITKYVVHWSSQFMFEVSQIIWTHFSLSAFWSIASLFGNQSRAGASGCRFWRSASIFSSRRGSSMGLVSKSSQPADNACSRSAAMACAVRAMTGMPRVAGSAFSVLVASQPV